jgi:hypothetical protein
MAVSHQCFEHPGSPRAAHHYLALATLSNGWEILEQATIPGLSSKSISIKPEVSLSGLFVVGAAVLTLEILKVVSRRLRVLRRINGLRVAGAFSLAQNGTDSFLPAARHPPYAK